MKVTPMHTDTTIHQPVMYDQVIQLLDPQPHKQYIDATIGGGGHTAGLLAQQAQVLGIDQDKDAIAYVSQRFAQHSNLTVVEANFMSLRSKAEQHSFTQVDGILFDLGVSSLQLDTASRGFSFMHDGPLDMRMNQSASETAADLVNSMAESELYELLITNAQENKARLIARAIVAHRPIHTTKELANIVSRVYGHKRHHIHPATKTFQALRIAVNQELKIIRPALKDAFELLKIGGRIVVISFHEGEDRIVKRTFLDLVQTGTAVQPGKQPLVPTTEEIARNPRARSAKLRCIERLQ